MTKKERIHVDAIQLKAAKLYAENVVIKRKLDIAESKFKELSNVCKQYVHPRYHNQLDKLLE